MQESLEPKQEFSIGDFAFISRLSIKTLRFYHQEGLLIPQRIDPESGYRFYGEDQLLEVKTLQKLKDLDFTLEEIKEVLLSGLDRKLLDKKIKQADSRARHYRRLKKDLENLASEALEPEIPEPGTVREISSSPLTYISLLYEGPYNEVGQGFAKLFKASGALVRGAPFCLYPALEHQENTSLELCVPVAKAPKGFELYTLEACACLELLHLGSYDSLFRSYKAVLDYVHSRNLRITAPSREFYLKGPGLLGPGNTKRYKTRIEIPLLKNSQ